MNRKAGLGFVPGPFFFSGRRHIFDRLGSSPVHAAFAIIETINACRKGFFMRTAFKPLLVAAVMAGAAALTAAPAKADGFGISFGPGGGISFSVNTGGYCDSWGCPEDYWGYPVYYGPVYWGGRWYDGPLYYRYDGGYYWYWVHGGWHRDEWRGPRPSWWRGNYRYGPALSLDYYRSHGFHVRDHDWNRYRVWSRTHNWDRDHHDWSHGHDWRGDRRVDTGVIHRDNREIRQDNRRLRDDRREQRGDRQDVRQDRRELHHDVQRGAGHREIRQDARELRGDRHEVRQDRQTRHNDRQERRHDRQDRRDDNHRR
jgi:hypothetical protein